MATYKGTGATVTCAKPWPEIHPLNISAWLNIEDLKTVFFFCAMKKLGQIYTLWPNMCLLNIPFEIWSPFAPITASTFWEGFSLDIGI